VPERGGTLLRSTVLRGTALTSQQERIILRLILASPHFCDVTNATKFENYIQLNQRLRSVSVIRQHIETICRVRWS
jgi:hypothetical protein